MNQFFARITTRINFLLPGLFTSMNIDHHTTIPPKLISDFCFISLLADSLIFSYFAEVITDENGRESLRYHDKKYVKHTSGKQYAHERWRCYLHYKGCRARMNSRIIGGYVMVNKPDAELIHTNHDAKDMRKRKNLPHYLDPINVKNIEIGNVKSLQK